MCIAMFLFAKCKSILIELLK